MALPEWSGPMPAVTTPFRADLSIDEESFAANIARLFEAGATGAIVAGCTGEFWALSMAERARLAALASKACNGRGPTIVGTGSILEAEVIEQISAAKEAGADAALVLPPFFATLTEAEVLTHFETVADKAALPVVLYNIPGNAGNAITPHMADRLADHENVVAIKESSGDWRTFQSTLNAVKGRMLVFCGPSSTIGVPAVLAGADGLVDCFPNVWANGCFDLWYKTKAGALKEAWALQETGIALTELFIRDGRTLYPSTKAVMNNAGLPGGGHMRPPYRDLDGAPLRGLLDGIAQLGITPN